MADTEEQPVRTRAGSFLPAIVIGAVLGACAALLIERDPPKTPLLFSADWQLEEKLRLCATVLNLGFELHSSQRETCAKIILEALDGIEN